MADFSKEDLMMLHFYWQSEDGSQQGPSDVAELKRAWKSKQLHKDCHVYGDDGFDDWMTIADLPILKKLIAPPPPPPRRKKAPAARAAAAAARERLRAARREARAQGEAAAVVDVDADAVIDAYNRAGNKPMPAHPYKLAKAAVGALVEDATRNQSILVSGESGAGKTEATKQCLSFLAEVAGSSGDIEQRVTNYLLEKSRVKGQSDDERNYHAFYQLCAAPVGARDYGVGDAGSYGYLRKCLEVRGIDDGADYDDVADATASLGFDDAQRSTVWGLVAGILKLGQVGFAALDGMSDGSAVDGGSAAVLAEVAAHLGVDGAQLGDALTHRTLSIRGQDDMAVPLREAQALENRDALSKYAYDHLFDWLVGRVNAALRAADADVACFIGILDIFGFEIFTLNSFEQLCINFTNEKLQQLFNEHTFKTEAATYEREGVPFPPIDFVDNQPICDLIEKRGGILTLLDDTVKGPGKPEQKDAKFSQNLDQACRANAFFVPANDHRGVRGAVFSVRHYAGTVCYSCDGFVEKNADTLYKD
ncbi:hypothetical protein JL722_3776 [Aureococcus anophagefferens]|nr:hypothetical protein JL722_3776 [Aureococcus anophagefferens]